jgi:bifunctional DNA-binding transcriptional regulator/antitoxin component of YhaV-PrlF toxin-antitoxin module
MKVEIRKVDDGLVVALPAEAVASLRWESGDVLAAEVVGDGLKLVRVETKHDRAMRIADEAMKDYRVTFDKLAKS